MALSTIGRNQLNTGIDDNSNATAITIDSSENVGVGTATPARQLEIFDDGTNGQAVLALTAQNTENSRIMFADPDDNNIGIIDYNHSNDSLRFVVNNAERMHITSAGEITKPTHPAFMAQPSSQQSDLAGDTNVDVLMGTEQYDVGSNFSSSTFTAPVTGKYFLSFTLYGRQLAGGANYMEMSIDTSNRNYTIIQEPSGTESVYAGGTVAVIADMDANDTANCRVTVGGSSTFDVTTSSRFTGALIC